MDAVYVDPINTVWTRFGSGLDYVKSLIKDSKLLSYPFDFSSTNSSGYMASKRVLFPFADTGVPPSSTDLANSSLRQFFSTHQRQIISVLSKLLGISVSAVTTYFLLKWLTRSLDPTNADKLAAKSRAEAIMKQLGVDPKTQELNEYELVIASNIILPSQIDCSWEDIGGLDHIADELRETVIYPLRNFDIGKGKDPSSYTVAAYTTKRSRLVQPPKGVLLFGPPGNAKTMIAKALAKESGARFINLQVSTLFDKWFGESQKRTEAVFSLAQKVQPVIIFIDEIDSFLRSRRIDDHECTSTMKTQFMTMWDGLTTSSQHNNRILIIGATNRPEDVDPAILRRMPQMFHIGLPNQIQRVKILKVILKDEILADDVDLNEIASRSAQFSGSDLHELCRCAAMNSYIETVRNSQKKEQQQTNQSSIQEMALSESNNEEENGHIIRKIDFDVAFEKLASKAFAMNINARERFDFNL